MVDVRIEYASPVHEPQIAAIEARSFSIAGPMLEEVKKSRRRDPGVRLVALDEKRIVGFVIGSWYFKVLWLDPLLRLRHLSINALAVDAPFRSSGIGRQLMTTLFERAGARGAESYDLMVQVENTRALALYASLGFERRFRARDVYGPGRDGLAMSRRARPLDRPAP